MVFDARDSLLVKWPTRIGTSDLYGADLAAHKMSENNVAKKWMG